jgi:hypothetical protein
MAIRQHLWTVEPKQHKTWPDPSKVIQKRKHSKTTDIRTQQERSSATPRESLKKYRQLQLWEAPQSIEVSNSTILKDINAAPTASSTEEDNNMAQKEQTAQVQWLHRWFDESTQEDLTHLPEADTWTGSSILRSLAKRKQQEHRHSRWSDRRQAPLELSTEFPYNVPVPDDTLHAILQWLTWITEEERHQSVQQQLEHPMKEYHRYLETTYDLLFRHHGTDNQVVEERTMLAPHTDAATNPSSLSSNNEANELTTPGCTWLISPPGTPRVEHSHIQLAGNPASPVRAPPPRRSSQRGGAHKKRNYCEEEIYTRPAVSEQPYGKSEGVAISTSTLPGAGRGLFGIKPSPTNPLLFKQANEFVCVYATMDDVISLEEAQTSESAYIWTNSKNLQMK